MYVYVLVFLSMYRYDDSLRKYIYIPLFTIVVTADQSRGRNSTNELKKHADVLVCESNRLLYSGFAAL